MGFNTYPANPWPMSTDQQGSGGSGGETFNPEVIAPEFSDTAQYMTGDLVFYEGSLYRFEEDHDTGAWDSTEVMATTISENLVMFPGDGLRRNLHEYMVKTQVGGGLAFDENGAMYTTVIHNFATQEQPTGQNWIDGKPIYFKVYTGLQLTNNTPVVADANFGSTNKLIDMRVILDGTTAGSTRNQCMASAYNEGGTYSVFPQIDGDTLQIVVRGDWTNYTADLVIYYTKPETT